MCVSVPGYVYLFVVSGGGEECTVNVLFYVSSVVISSTRMSLHKD